MDPFDPGNSRERTTVFVIIVVFHVILIYALNSSLSRVVVERIFGPIKTQIIEEVKPEDNEPPPPPPKMEVPPPFVPPPDFAIEAPVDTGPSRAIQVVTDKPRVAAPEPKTGVRIAPRPDERVKKRGWAPEMPPSIRRTANKAQVLGSTTVRCLVGTDGKCERVDVLESSGNPVLDETAVSHAQRVWRFTPGTEDGQPVTMNYDLKITWKITD